MYIGNCGGDEVSKKRNTALDFAKGATILLMMWAHIHLDSIWITSFHMPLFFILSGYFIKEEPFTTTLKKKAKGLLIPYLIMEMIYLVSTIIFEAATNPSLQPTDVSWMWPIVKDRLLGTLLANSFCISWFVWVLFGSTMVYVLINRLRAKMLWLYGILIIACSVLGYLFSEEWVRNPYRWDVILFVVPFIAIGHLAKLYINKLTPVVKWVVFVLCLAVWIVDIVISDAFSIAMCVYGLYPVTLIGAVAGTYVVVTLCEYLDKIPVLNDVMRWFGRNTLAIMCFSVVTANVMEWHSEAYTGSEPLTFVIQIAMVTVLIFLWTGIKTLCKREKNSS